MSSPICLWRFCADDIKGTRETSGPGEKEEYKGRRDRGHRFSLVAIQLVILYETGPSLVPGMWGSGRCIIICVFIMRCDIPRFLDPSEYIADILS